MFGRRFGWGFSLIGLLVIVAAAAGIGYLAYNAGVNQGVAQAADLPAGELPPAHFTPYGHYRPFGFGFGLLGCLVPLLLFFLFFGGIRMLFMPWRMRHWGFGPGWGRGPGGGHGPGWGHKDPERWKKFRDEVDRWYEQMHQDQPSSGDQPKA